MRKSSKNAIAQLRMTTLATNAFWLSGKEEKKNRNRVINNKFKTKLHYEVWKIDRESQRCSPDQAGDKKNHNKSKSKYNAE